MLFFCCHGFIQDNCCCFFVARVSFRIIFFFCVGVGHSSLNSWGGGGGGGGLGLCTLPENLSALRRHMAF